jgi:Fic family protein
MRFEDFKSGIWRQQYQYKSFLPVLINQEWSWEDPRLNVLLESATRALGELNAYTRIIPDVDLFIQMHIRKEANTSSRIEGTKTEIEDDVLSAEEVAPEKRDDWQEVQNYVEAMNGAVKALETLPLSLRLLRDTHALLLKGSRGEHKTPGEFRASQNWIGGASPTDAAFVPPVHADMPELLADLEAFWHNPNVQVPHLIRIAISHYQFETIHPFQDGNGRIGRLMIPLYLVSNTLLNKPALYLSAHFEKYRSEYYDALSRVRASNDMGGWCRFFLKAIIDTATNGRTTFEKVLALRTEMDTQVFSLGRRAENARKLIQYLYASPAISLTGIENVLGIKRNPARELLTRLEQLGVLEEMTGFKRNRIFLFNRYLAIFRDHRVGGQATASAAESEP